jgi:phosphoribosylformylglycinamidine cyclo-ligase
MKNQKITYSEVGDNYDTKDPIKIHAQKAAFETGKNLLKHGFEEFSDSRGESAYVWQQGDIYMAAVAEQLGTKNLVADETRKITGKTYYDSIAHDTVATIINDLVTVGAQPLVLHAYWAIENNDWLADEERMTDLINGWKSACDLAGASWGGGETPTLKGIIEPNTVALGGSAIGIVSSKKRLLTDKNIKQGDRILFLKSTGINANGLSLSRAIAKKLPKGYATKMETGELYGEAILTPTNIYAKLIQDMLDANIELHYISNITGHGLRKIMRARADFTYIIEKLFEPQELFLFMQKHANLSDYEMYDEFNMGQDYALFLPEKDIKKAQEIIRKNDFESLDAGYVESGERKVVLKPKEITFTGESLKVRI